MRKRIISIFLLMAMLALSAMPAFAATSNDDWLFDLQAFGILESGSKDELNLDKQVTRSEFVTMLAAALGVDEWNLTAAAAFSDVTTSASYYKDLSNLVAMGLISGDGTSAFRPDDTITRDEVSKLVVSALGYYYLAEQNGGYPVGYVVQASSLSLFKGASITGNELNKKAIAKILYNALDVEMLVNEGVEYGQYVLSASSDNTLRSLHENETDTGMQRLTGVISATAECSLYRQYEKLKTDEVVIGGKVYKSGETRAYEYLGQEVNFYVKSDADNVILSIQPSKNNEVWEVSDNEYVKASSAEIRFMNEEDREESIDIDKSAVIVRNMRPVIEVNDDTYKLEQGSLRAIDNNGDGVADIVFYEEFESFRVDKVVDNSVYFADGKTLAGKPLITIEEDDEIFYQLMDASGKEIAVSEVQKDDVVSIVAAADSKTFKIYDKAESVQGRIGSVVAADYEIVIEGIVYPYEKKLVTDAKPGDAVTAYFNFRGEVADLKIDESTANYAYVLKYEASSGVGGGKVKILIPGLLKDDEEIDESNENNKTSIPKLKGYNSGVKILDLADSVRIDGVKHNASALGTFFADEKNCVIKYSTNGDEQITKIEFPKRIDTIVDLKYNAYERCFGAYETGAFGTDNDTKVICVPKNEVSSDDDYYASVDITNNESYTVVGFDMQDNDHAKLAVIKMTMKYDNILGVNENSKFSVLKRIEQRVNEDGDEQFYLTFMSEGKMMNYPVAEFVAVDGPDGRSLGSSPEVLRPGAVFYYTLSPMDQIAKIKLIQNVSPMPEEGQTTINTDRLIFGTVDNVDYNRLVNEKNRYVDKVTINTGRSSTRVEVFVRNPPPIYIYNRATNEITKGASTDLMSNLSNTKVFVHISNEKVKGLLLVRN